MPYQSSMSDRSITILKDGEYVGAIHNTDPEFETVRAAVVGGEEEKVVHLLPNIANTRLVSATKDFEVRHGQIFYHTQDGDVSIEGELGRLLLSFLEDLSFIPDNYKKFVMRLMKNTSYRVRTQLYEFMAYGNFQLLADGRMVCYKAIDGETYKDIWSGTIDNSPGQIVSVPRASVNDDFTVACSFGLHVGTLDYILGYGGNTATYIAVFVAPEDVVTVPKDHAYQKMRVCKYEVGYEIAPDVVAQLKPTSLLDDDGNDVTTETVTQYIVDENAPYVVSMSGLYPDDDDDNCDLCGQELDLCGDCPGCDYDW